MSDSFEFTLHSPLTQEDWNKLTDAELKNTIFITFQTPQGRQVKYVKYDMLDKIKAEIEQMNNLDYVKPITVNEVLQIIDKYMTEKGIQKEYLKP